MRIDCELNFNFKIYLSANGVWLTKEVPTEYLSKI